MDVVTTMSDPSIPLTTGEWEEVGAPLQQTDLRCCRICIGCKRALLMKQAAVTALAFPARPSGCCAA